MDKELEEFNELIPVVKARDGYKCTRCHTRKNITVHHLKPRELGGTNELRNLVTLCYGCHNYVEHHDPVWTEIKKKAPKFEKNKCCDVKWSRNEFGLVATHTHFV